MVPQALCEELRDSLRHSRALWEQDREARRPGVEMPPALARKYPRAAESFIWYWVFPAPTLSRDPRTGLVRRHHVHEQVFQRAIAKAVRRAENTHVLNRGGRGVVSPLDRL